MTVYPIWPCSYQPKTSVDSIKKVKSTKKIISTSDSKPSKLNKKVSEYLSKQLVLDLGQYLETFKHSFPQIDNQIYEGPKGPTGPFAYESFQGSVIFPEGSTVTTKTTEIIANYSLFNNSDPTADAKKLIEMTCEAYGIDSSNIESIIVEREYGSNVHKITVERYIF